MAWTIAIVWRCWFVVGVVDLSFASLIYRWRRWFVFGGDKQMRSLKNPPIDNTSGYPIPVTMPPSDVQNIPKLPNVSASYPLWRAAIDVALQMNDCWEAVLGIDGEPGRVEWEAAVPVSTPGLTPLVATPGMTPTAIELVQARNVRAASARPTKREMT